MNIEKLKQTTFEDYQRRFNDVIVDISTLENEPTGLFKRILNTDRQLLYECMGNVVNVSQSSIIYNRDELSFFESLGSLFSYYMYDDGELAILWKKYKDGDFVECNKTDKFAKPVLGFFNENDPNCKIAREKEIHWLIDWHENERKQLKTKYVKLWGEDDEDIKDMDKKEYIDYN